MRALGGITTIAVTSALLGAGPAQAREADPRPGPLVVHAVPDKAAGPHFNSQATVEVPAGGAGNVVSPTMPKDMTTAKVTVSTSLSDEDGFKSVALALLGQPTPGKRLMACISMAHKSLAASAWSAAMQGELDVFEALAEQLFAARLQYCMQVAALIASVEAEAPRGRLASTPCGQVPLGIKEKVTKSGGTYTLTKDGPATVKGINAKVKVKCTLVSATKTVMTIKPKRKGSTLRKALRSKSLAVALGSADSAQSGATVTVAFAAP